MTLLPLLLLAGLALINSASGTKGHEKTCVYPNGDKGKCLSLAQCPKLAKVEKKLESTMFDTVFGKLLCSDYDNTNRICCPNDSFQPSGIPALATNDSKCVNPKGDDGECMIIDYCDALRVLLHHQNKPGVSQFLRSSICGTDGKKLKVCCPKKAMNQQTPKPDTATAKPLPSVTYDSNHTRLPSVHDCGYSKFDEAMIDFYHVVKGKESKDGAWPWMAALGFETSDGGFEYGCGGTLITDQHILTAAHCLPKGRKLAMVRLGDFNLYSDEDDFHATSEEVESVFIHEKYSTIHKNNDIAVLKLKRRVKKTAFIMPVCLPTPGSMESKDFENRELHIAGWGRTENDSGRGSSTLIEATVKGAPQKLCENIYRPFNSIIDDTVFCAGNVDEHGSDTCRGDSGGPITERRKRYFQVGIVSYGLLCGYKGHPGVYTRVSAFMDWIIKIVDEKS